MLFNGGRDIAQDLANLGVAKELDFEGYVLDKVEVDRVPVQLEDLHRGLPRGLSRGPFHPGLGNFVTCDDLRWEFGDWHSVQTVGVNKALGKPGTTRTRLARRGAALQGWRAAAARRDLAHLLPERDGRVVPARARDLDAPSDGPEKCRNVVEFYYPEEIALFEREFVEPSRRPITRPRSRTRRSACA
jgi:hypothetical protein